MIYLYAVIDRAPGPPPILGLAGRPLRYVAASGLFVAVGEVRRAPAVVVEALRELDRTLRTLCKRCQAVLPFRFGSVVPDLAAVARVIEERGDVLHAALDVVRGRQQMTVRVYPRPAGRRRRAAGKHVRAPSSHPGARYLRSRARPMQEALRGVKPLRAVLSRFAHEESIEVSPSQPVVVTLYHLIDRGRSDAYATAVRRAAAKLAPARVVVSGPWPPHAFAGGGVA